MVVGTAALAALLNNVPVGWAVPFAAALAAISYDLTTLCNVDPPALPVITAGDCLALLSPAGDQAAYTAAVTKFQQLIQVYAWYQFCQCVNVATPAPPAAPAAPANLPNTAPPIPPIVVSSCGTLPLMWSNTIGTGPAGPGLEINGAPVPAGATTLQFSATINFVGANHPQVTWHTGFFKDSNQTQEIAPDGTIHLASTTYDVLNGPQTSASTVIYTVAVPPGALFCSIQSYPTANSTDTATVTGSWYCGGQPGAPLNPCCPPDATATGLLNQVLQLVTLIQRQVVPFAYLSSTVHAGLTGAGSFAIPALVGVKAAVTALPLPIGQSGTSPTEYFDLGYITFGTPDGYDHSYRLEHNPQIMMPPRCSAFTQLAYDLHAGTTITITELLREP